MGKKIIGVIAFAAIAVAAGWNLNLSKNETQLSELTLKNIEALAKPAEEGVDFGCNSSSIWCYFHNGSWINGEFYRK